MLSEVTDARNCKHSGVYAIRNRISGKHYVGSAVHLQRRTRDHFAKLATGKHENKHLQNSFNRHGAEAFWVEVIELVPDKERLTEREQHYLDSTEPKYNILKIARSALGFKHSREELERIKLRVQTKFAAMNDEERRAFVAEIGFTMSGKKHSDETKALMSLTRIGRVRSEATRARASAAWKDPDHVENYARSVRIRADMRACEYVLTNPDGAEFRIKNMTQFCKENDLSQAHMTSVASGKRKAHKGWLARKL